MSRKVTKNQLTVDIGIMNNLYKKACCGEELHDYENRSIKRVLDDLVEIRTNWIEDPEKEEA